MLYQKILITGAGGFLGGRMAEGLTQAGYAVRATARNNAPQAKLEALGAEFIAAELCDPEAVGPAVAGCDAIVHCAAKSSPWGPYNAFYAANVQATEWLLAAAQKQGIRRFIHISTPSIYYEFRHRRGVKESDPLPANMVNHYAATKLIAEEKVLQSGLSAMILRPRAIIGRGDTVIMPRFLKAFEENKLRRIGSGENVVSVTPAANVVEAVKCALTAPEAALGKAYNITSGEDVLLWGLIGEMLGRLELDRKLRPLPFPVAMFLAKIMDAYSRYFSKKEPALTPYSIGLLAYDMTLDIAQARELLGYQPVQTASEGVAEFAQWWRHPDTIHPTL